MPCCHELLEECMIVVGKLQDTRYCSLYMEGMLSRDMKQFLIDQAKDDVLTAWRGLKLEKGESMQKYTDKFWDLHLKVTVYMNIDFSKQNQQYCVGLNEDMKTYINAQKPKTNSKFIHHAMISTKIFMPNKSIIKPPDNGEKTFGKDCANKYTKAPSNKDQRTNGNKKKEGKEYKGQNKLSPTDLEKYMKENRCFRCTKQGHSYHNCPKKTQGTPQEAHILSTHDDEVPSSSQLLYT